MNRSFRSLFNTTLQSWVAVPEIARSHVASATTRGTGRRKSPGRRAALAATLFALAPLPLAMAQAVLPTAPSVLVPGSATVTTAGDVMTVNQTANRAIIEWGGFNVGAGKTVNFTQPGATSAILNRVTGSDPTAIHGTLTSNGQVFIVNPNGVLVGQGASVNVGSLGLSTLAISNDDFNAGRYRFAGSSSASVTNLGNITVSRGGFVAMAGLGVTNGASGVITADHGAILMGAGSDVTVTPEADSKLAVSATGTSRDSLNAGALKAASGVVALSSVFKVARNEGSIDVSATGTEDGGRVQLGGAAVRLAAGSSIHANAEAGHGGEVIVKTAGTFGSSSETISANSGAGVGGRFDVAAIWWELAYGVVDVGGASQGGSISLRGTSAHSSSVLYEASLLARSSKGNGGTITLLGAGDLNLYKSSHIDTTGLLNVGTVQLTAGSAITLNPQVSIKTGTLQLRAKDLLLADGSTNIASGLLSAVLSSGANLELRADNDLTVSQALLDTSDASRAGKLTLEAGRSVLLNAGITRSAGDISITANQRAAAGINDARRDAGAGGLTMAAGTTLSTGGKMALAVADGAGLTNAQAGVMTLAKVTAADLSISTAAPDGGFEADSKTYDGTTTATVRTASMSGLQFTADTNLSATTVASDAAFADKNAGQGKTVTAKLTSTITGYNGTASTTTTSQASTTADITPRDLAVTATVADKTEDGTTGAQVTETKDDRVDGNQLTVVTGPANFDSAAAGDNKTVTVNGVTATGADSGNYRLPASVRGTASIRAKPAKPVVPADPLQPFQPTDPSSGPTEDPVLVSTRAALDRYGTRPAVAERRERQDAVLPRPQVKAVRRGLALPVDAERNSPDR